MLTAGAFRADWVWTSVASERCLDDLHFPRADTTSSLLPVSLSLGMRNKPRPRTHSFVSALLVPEPRYSLYLLVLVLVVMGSPRVGVCHQQHHGLH